MSFNNQYRSSGFGMLPVVTKNIIIINIIMYVATILLKLTQNIDLADYFGLHYYLAPDFKPHQFITYIFMHQAFDSLGHISVTHILFNMIGVYFFGQVLEQTWGPKRYLTFYILTGLGAALAQYAILHFELRDWLIQVNNEIDKFKTDAKYVAHLIDIKSSTLNGAVIVGASGSLFGILGAFAMLFPNTMILVYFLFPVKAKWLIIAYGAFELFSGLSNNPGDNVAHFAHLGGLFVGIILVLIWRKNRNHFY